MDLNPFASPEGHSASGNVNLTDGHRPSIDGVWVYGKYLVVPPVARLPLTCVKSGIPILQSDMHERRLARRFFAEEREICLLTYGIHPAVRRQRRIYLILNVVTLIVLLVSMPFLTFYSMPGFFVSLIALFGALVVLIQLFSPLTVALLENGAFRVSGCCREFLENFEMLAIQHKVKYKQEGGRNCLACGVLFKPSLATAWHQAGYCSRVCHVQKCGTEAGVAFKATDVAPVESLNAKQGQIMARCSAGHDFAVQVSFAGMFRPCPTCGQKTLIPQR